jgi:hypothetical protein
MARLTAACDPAVKILKEASKQSQKNAEAAESTRANRNQTKELKTGCVPLNADPQTFDLHIDSNADEGDRFGI